MMDDETEGPGRRSADRPDPSFIKRLEDEWGESESRRERAVRRAGETRRSARYSAADPRHTKRQSARRSRKIAVAVLVVAAVVVLIAGLQVKDSQFGSSKVGPSTPFSLVPFDSSGATATTVPATTSTSTTTPTSTTDSATTTSVVGLAFR